MQALERVASRHGLALVEDCCQAHLATANGRPVGTIGVAGAFSFYPTKNLGALGDGGAVVTNDAALAERVRRIRNGGQTDRYHHELPGVNSRLDEMQAAILRARLPFLAGWTASRRRLAVNVSARPVRRARSRASGARSRSRLPSVRGALRRDAPPCSNICATAESKRSCTTRFRFRNRPLCGIRIRRSVRRQRGLSRSAVAAAVSCALRR